MADEKQAAGLYSIEGFNSEAGRGMGGYGFSIVLDGRVVKHLLETARTPDAPMLKMLEARLRGSLGKFAAPELRFYENTWLLLGMTAGGQCACFGPDGGFDAAEACRRGLRYSPHNIDSREQAAAILSTWLLWFNGVLPTFTPYRLPFRM